MTHGNSRGSDKYMAHRIWVNNTNSNLS